MHGGAQGYVWLNHAGLEWHGQMRDLPGPQSSASAPQHYPCRYTLMHQAARGMLNVSVIGGRGRGGSCNNYYWGKQNAVDVNEDCVSVGGGAAGHNVNHFCSTLLHLRLVSIGHVS